MKAAAKSSSKRKAPRKMRTAKPAKPPALPEVDPAFLPIVSAFATDRDVSRKKMFSSSSVLSVKGKIFAMLVKGRFVAKLPKPRVDQLVADGQGDFFDPGHGRPMKEWVSLRAARPPWVDLAQEAYRFVKGLDQPTKVRG
jgi:TfoX/Sxy family transcriptional regulator of competence genes